MTGLLALDLLAAHLVADFVLQPHWMAVRKLAEWRVRALHVAVHVSVFWPLATTYAPMDAAGVAFLVLLAVAHFVTDSRRWVPADHPWPPKALVVDQAIHVVTLAVLARLLVP